MITTNTKLPAKVKQFEAFLLENSLPFSFETDETDISILYIFKSEGGSWYDPLIRTAFYKNKLADGQPVSLLLTMGYGFNISPFDIKADLREHHEAWLVFAQKEDNK